METVETAELIKKLDSVNAEIDSISEVSCTATYMDFIDQLDKGLILLSTAENYARKEKDLADKKAILRAIKDTLEYQIKLASVKVLSKNDISEISIKIVQATTDTITHEVIRKFLEKNRYDLGTVFESEILEAVIEYLRSGRGLSSLADEFVNLTGKAVTVMVGNLKTVIPPAGPVARIVVDSSSSRALLKHQDGKEDINVVPIVRERRKIENLPKAPPVGWNYKWLIVTADVKYACPNREDVVFPSNPTTLETGEVVYGSLSL